MTVAHRIHANNQLEPYIPAALLSAVMRSLFQNVRYAIRGLRKRPAFSLIVIVTLALGIGANTAIFSVVNAVLLSPLPYGDPGKLVVVWAKNEKQNVTQAPVSFPNIMDLKQANSVFEHLAWAKNDKQNVTQAPVSYPNIVDLKQANSVFEHLDAVRP